jgi:hypothetical protein
MTVDQIEPRGLRGILYAPPLRGEALKQAVWNEAQPIPGCELAEWRFEAHGKPARWQDYGDRQSPYGWELDHFPISKANGGPDERWNLRILNCADNAANLHHGPRGGLLGI